MARVIKIDNALQKRFSQKTKKKKTRQIVIYFLIVCEGEQTEPNYFKSFPKKHAKYVFDFQFEGGGISTIKVVEKAIELRDSSKQKYDRVWAVFDRDSFKKSSFDNAIAKAEANNIKCAWSNQAFELWYLLHFHNRITAMHRDEYKKAIEKAINDKNPPKLFQYRKNTVEMYNLLKRYGDQAQAIKWAEKLSADHIGTNYSMHNPSTQVYELVKELIGVSQELNDEIKKKIENRS